MKKIGYGLSLIVLANFLFSCSGAKKVIENKTAQNEEITFQLTDTEKQERNQKEFEMFFVEALKQKMLGNVQATVQLLSRCMEIDSSSAVVLYELANIYAANGDLTHASPLLEKAVSINSENKWYKVMLAQIYQQQRKFEQASGIYSQLLEIEPENQEYLYTYAVLLSNAGKKPEAIEAYDILEKKTGINEQISIEKQQLYTSIGNEEKAFAEIQKLIDSSPMETRYLGVLADLYLEYGDGQNALKYYNKILEIEPDNGFVHFLLANYYITQGDYDKVIEEAKLGFKNDDIEIQTKFQFYMMLTSNREQTKITDQQAEEFVRILLDKHSDESLVHTLFAETLLLNNKLSEAREQLLIAVGIESNDYVIWERIFFIDNELQDWDELYEHSKEAISFFPNQPQPYFFNGIACSQLEKYDETIAITVEGLRYVVDNKQLQSQFLMLQGEVVYKLNRHDEAFKLFDSVIELVPDNYIALNNYAYYLSLAGKDLGKAETMSAKVIEQFPNNSTYLDTYAWIFFKKGEYKLARFYMQSALNNGGQDNPTLLEHYGDILFMLEMKDEAKQYWEKAKINGSDSKVLDSKISEQRYIEE
ncbi:MAG: tetratricopeptide repeat protein [Bacteroidales bacterium]|nr:tetratricopeptide repeat protein [Bacteroidales bacterium]